MAARSHIGKIAKILFSLIAALVIFVALIFFYIATPYFTAEAGSWLTNRDYSVY